MIVYVLSFGIITLLVLFLIYSIRNFDRKKKEEAKAINNIALILNKLDTMDNGGKMQQDIKKLAKYLGDKLDNIEESQQELLETQQEILERIESTLGEKEIDDDEGEFGNEGEEEANPFDVEEDEIKVETTEKKIKSGIPPALDPEKRKMDYIEEEIQKRVAQVVEKGGKEVKKEKKGLFGRKK